MTKRQEFRVVCAYRDFEVREYQPCVIAEVNVSADYATAASTAFGSLFKYISKGNNASEKIAMTAPVISAQREPAARADEWFVSFVMPAGSTIGRMPLPNDPRVHLRQLEAETCVATSFKGTATVKKSELVALQLRLAASKENIELSAETRVCRFDPPFKPGFMQYNEIVIPVYVGEL